VSRERAGETRAFVALALDDRVRRAMGELQRELVPRLGGIRFVRPEGIHLTLRFLGASREDQLARLRPALAEAAAACAPAEAALRQAGTFPERGDPRVLWLEIELPEQMRELQQKCERAARRLGFEPETRPFRPHLTLGRWRNRAPHPELPAVDLGVTRLETLVLFESDLRPGGAVYTPLAQFALGGKGGATP